MTFTIPVTLTGEHAQLVPLSPTHEPALIDAVRDGELWKLWYTSVPSPDAVASNIAQRLALQEKGSMLPFTVLDAAGKVVGMTTYMNIDATHKRVEIGATWYAASAQRSALNDLQNATAEASNLLSSDCPTYRALTPVGRLQAMEQRLDAMLHAVQTVQPALEKFYASLGDEQKERFNRLSPAQG